MYTSPVLRVDAPAGTFCFLQKHLLILLSVGQDDVSSARASQADPDLHSLRGPPEQLLSKNASKIIVKHSGNEKPITKTNKKHSKINNLEIEFLFSLFFMPKRRKNEPIRGSRESRGSPGSRGSGPRTAARHLPNTRRGLG